MSFMISSETYHERMVWNNAMVVNNENNNKDISPELSYEIS